MHRALTRLIADEPGADLHHAAGIPCDYRVRIRGRDVRELALEDFVAAGGSVDEVPIYRSSPDA